MTITAFYRTRASIRTIRRSFPRFSSIEERVGILVFTLMLILALSHPLWAHGFEIGSIEIDHPIASAPPEGAKVAAGYMILKNSGAVTDRLVSISSEIAGRTELHDMSVDAQGVMTMRPVTGGLEIPAGSEVALKRGSYHVMFMDLKRPIEEGESFNGTLTFEKAGTVDITFKVEGRPGTEHHDHGS
jgi:copper(I)-binding protein